MAGWAGWRRDKDRGSRRAARRDAMVKKGTADKAGLLRDIFLSDFTPFANIIV